MRVYILDKIKGECIKEMKEVVSIVRLEQYLLLISTVYGSEIANLDLQTIRIDL